MKFTRKRTDFPPTGKSASVVSQSSCLIFPTTFPFLIFFLFTISSLLPSSVSQNTTNIPPLDEELQEPEDRFDSSYDKLSFGSPCLNGARESEYRESHGGQDDPNCRRPDFVEKTVQEFHSPEIRTHLAAISGEYLKRVYPPRAHTTKALKRYAEPPYPIPIGTTIFFTTFTVVMVSFYLRKLVNRALNEAAKKVDLHTELEQFPEIKLYTLQESKREAKLRREARNTLAWLARRYRLMQNDPNVDLEVFKTTWADFDVPRDVWSIVRTVLQATSFLQKVKNSADKQDRRSVSFREDKQQDNPAPGGIEVDTKSTGSWLRDIGSKTGLANPPPHPKSPRTSAKEQQQLKTIKQELKGILAVSPHGHPPPPSPLLQQIIGPSEQHKAPPQPPEVQKNRVLPSLPKLGSATSTSSSSYSSFAQQPGKGGALPPLPKGPPKPSK